MCKNCSILKAAFQSAPDHHMNYSPVLEMVKVMEKHGRVQLYAGDCLLSEIDTVLEEEKHYTVKHYIRCTECGQIYFLGACIRGRPAYKVVTDMGEEQDMLSAFWGKRGALYET